MRLGGELAFLLTDIEYESKRELLDKLRLMRDNLQNYPKDERIKIKPILAVSIQQAFYTSEWELLRFKKLSNKSRGEDGRTKKDDKSLNQGTV